MNIELHPLCVLFPRMTGPEFAALVADIKANGLRTPIVLHDGMVLDGGNRYAACQAAGVEPKFAEFAGGNLVSFVLSANMHRRHMTPGQQAAIVASAQDWATAQGRGGNRKADQSQAVDFDSVAKRSAASGASRVTQMKADKVAKASPELARQVAHGEVSLPKALAQVTPKPAAEPEPIAESAPPADDANDFDPIAELERLQAELISTQALVTAAEAVDLKAEAMKWRRCYDSAVRAQSDAMDRASKYEKELSWYGNQFKRIGKALGETDPSKVAARIEALVRSMKEAA